jgi:hypothetical protein
MGRLAWEPLEVPADDADGAGVGFGRRLSGLSRLRLDVLHDDPGLGVLQIREALAAAREEQAGRSPTPPGDVRQGTGPASSSITRCRKPS